MQARRKFLEEWRAKWDHHASSSDPDHHDADADDPEEEHTDAGNIEAGSQAFAASAAETPRGLGARFKKIASTVHHRDFAVSVSIVFSFLLSLSV